MIVLMGSLQHLLLILFTLWISRDYFCLRLFSVIVLVICIFEWCYLKSLWLVLSLATSILDSFSTFLRSGRMKEMTCDRQTHVHYILYILCFIVIFSEVGFRVEWWYNPFYLLYDCFPNKWNFMTNHRSKDYKSGYRLTASEFPSLYHKQGEFPDLECQCKMFILVTLFAVP